MQYELVLIFRNADRNTECHRATCLVSRNPPRVRLKDGEYLFVLWDCLALEKSPIDLVDLPHSVYGEALDLICRLRWHPLCGQFQIQKEGFNAADKFNAGFKTGLDILSTGASGPPMGAIPIWRIFSYRKLLSRIEDLCPG